MTDSTTTHDLLAVSLADEVIVNRDGSTARQSIGNLAAQIWGLGDTDPIAAATSAAAEAAQTAEIAAAAAEAALDATVPAGGWDYAPADLTALAAITGMTEGARAYVVSEQEVYRYDGAGWIATGENPLSGYARADAPGLVVGATGDENIAYALTFDDLIRTWVQVAPDGGLTDHARDQVMAALSPFISADKFLHRRDGPTGTANVQFGFVTEDLIRTWLEVAEDYGPSDYAIQRLRAALEPYFSAAADTVLVGAAVPITGLNSPPSISSPWREHPIVRKLDVNPIIDFAGQSAESIMWPFLVDLSQSGVSGYALVYSTDHAEDADSGIYAFHTLDPINGPWTDLGRIFDTTQTDGQQVETPSIMWDEVNSRWLMYYQVKFFTGSRGSQVTCVATSPTFFSSGTTPATWTFLQKTHDVNLSSFYPSEGATLGDGHSGYFKPFRHAGRWYGYGLMGGTDNSTMAFWLSNDGLEWAYHPKIIQHMHPQLSHLSGYNVAGYVFSVHSSVVIERSGVKWIVGRASQVASGGAEVTNIRTVAMPIGDDGVSFGRAIDITPPDQAWEDAGRGVESIGNGVMYQGRLICPYRNNGAQGAFGLLEIL